MLLVGISEMTAKRWGLALREAGFSVASVETPEDAEGLPRILSLVAAGISVDGPLLSLPPQTSPEDILAAVLGATRHPAAAPETSPPPSAPFRAGPWQVEPAAHRMVGPSGEIEELSPLEVGLLSELAAAQGESVSREDLLRRVWGYSPGVVSRAVDHLVSRLRARMELAPGSPPVLIGERGLGYRLASQRLAQTSPVAAPAGLVGRQSEIALVLDAWARGARLVTVCGAPGAGKSSLARACAAAVGLPEAALPDLPERGAVMIDDVVGDGLLRWLLASSDRRAIVASRGLQGAPFEVRVQASPLPQREGAALALREASRLSIPLPAPDAGAIAEICGGNPLAISLAVERSRLVGVGELLADARRDPIGTLAVPFRYPQRHASLRAALAYDPPPPKTSDIIRRIARGEEVDLTDEALSDAIARGFVVRDPSGIVAAPLWRGAFL